MKHLYLEKKEKLKLEERSKQRISSPIRHRQVYRKYMAAMLLNLPIKYKAMLIFKAGQQKCL